MPEQMKGGEIGYQAVIDTQKMDRQLDQEIPRRAVRGGQKAAESFGRGFSGSDEISDSARRAIRRIVDDAESTFRETIARADFRLAEGIIDEDEFRRVARRAVEQFNDEIGEAERALERAGVSGRVRQRLVGEMRQTGEDAVDGYVQQVRADVDEIDRAMAQAGRSAGGEFGEQARRETQSRFDRLRRWVRGAFAVGILASFGFVTTRIVDLFRRAADQIREILELGGTRERLERAFQNLTTTRGLDPADTLRQLQQAARGTSSEMELMRRTNEALQTGLEATSGELATLVENARRLARSLDRETDEAFRRFIQGIVRGRRRLLDDIGVVVDFNEANRRMAEQLGKNVDALTEQEQIQGRLNEVIRVTNGIVDDMGEDSLGTSERVAQLTAAWDDLTSKTALAVSQSPRIAGLLRDMAEDAENAEGQIDELALKIGALVDTIAGFRISDLPRDSVLRFWLEANMMAGEAMFDLSGLDELDLGDQFDANVMRRRIENAEDLVMLRATERAAMERIQEEIDATADMEADRADERLDQLEEWMEMVFRAADRREEAIRNRPATGGADGDEGDQGTEESAEDAAERIKALRDLGRSRAEIAKARGASEERVQELLDQTQRRVNRIVQSELERLRAAGASKEELAQVATLYEAVERATDRTSGSTRELVEEIELLDELGIEEQFGRLPERVQEAIDEFTTLRGQIRELEAIPSAERTDAQTQALERLRTEAEGARETIRRFATGQVEFGRTLTESEQKIQDVIDKLGFFQAAGIDAFSMDVPDQLISTLQELGSANQRILQLRQALRQQDVGEEMERQGRKALAVLERQRDALREQARGFDMIRDVVERFGNVPRDLFEGLDASEIDAVVASFHGVADEMRAVEEARRELKLAEMSGDADRVREAQDNLDDKTQALALSIEQWAEVLRAAGVEGNQLAKILDILTGKQDDASEATDDLAETLQEVAEVADGILSVADAMGVLDDQSRRALQGVQQVAEAAASIAATGPSVGNIAQGVGGLIQVGAALLGGGESPEERRVREAMNKLRTSIERLKASIDRQREALSSLPGHIVDSVRSAVTETVRGGVDPGELEVADVTLRFQDALEKFGVSMSELLRLAEAFDLPTDALEQFIQEGADFDAFQTLTKEQRGELMQTIGAVFDFLNVSLEETFETARGQMELLNQEFELFDITDPIKQLERIRELFLEFVDLPAPIEEAIRSADLSTPEGRAQFEEAMQQAWKGITSGEIGQEALGDMSFDEFMDWVMRMEGLADEASEQMEGEGTGAESFEIFRGVSEVSFDRALGVWTTMDFRLSKIVENTARTVAALGGEGLHRGGFLEPGAFGGPTGGNGDGEGSGPGGTPIDEPGGPEGGPVPIGGGDLVVQLGDLVAEISVEGSDQDLSGLAQAIEKQLTGKIAKSIERRMRDKGFYKRNIDGR